MAGVIALALLALLCGAASAEAPTRADYVTRLEQICKPGSEATGRAVHGIRGDIRSERLARAAARLTRARRIFRRTISTIAKVPRPPDDAPTLARWFDALDGEELYLGRMATALRASNVARFQRVWAKFIHEGNRANNVVVSFGFSYCSFKPSRYQ